MLHVINGYVHVLSNPEKPGLVKIGYTERDVQERVTELNSPGISSLFEVEAIFESSEPYQDEQKIHNDLSNFRYSENRGFFKIDLKEALNSIVESLSKVPCQIKNPALIFSEEEVLQRQALEREKKSLEGERQRLEKEKLQKTRNVEEEHPSKLANERKEQKRLQEKNDLMKEYQITDEELKMIESERTDEDRNFYKGMSDNEILSKKLWESKNWK